MNCISKKFNICDSHSLFNPLLRLGSGITDLVFTCESPIHKTLRLNCWRSIFSSLHIDTDRPHLYKFSSNYVDQLSGVPRVSCSIYISDPKPFFDYWTVYVKCFRLASTNTSLLEISTETFGIAVFDINSLLLCHTWYQQFYSESTVSFFVPLPICTKLLDEIWGRAPCVYNYLYNLLMHLDGYAAVRWNFLP